MNYLFCKLNRKQLYSKDIKFSENNLTQNNYKSNELLLNVQREQVGRNQQLSTRMINNTLFVLFGQIYDDIVHNYKMENYAHDIELISEIYFKYGVMKLQNLNGFYTALIIDYNARKAYCIQDRHLSYEHIYFYQDTDFIYLSTNVKDVLREADLCVEMDTTLLPTYLHYGFVPGEDSMFKKLKKIPSNSVLMYDFDTDKLALKKNRNKTSINALKAPSKSNIINIFDDIIKQYTQDYKDVKIGFTLSGGFDSNFIVSRALNYVGDKDVNVFSYGYDDSCSEINKTDRIVEIYKNKGYQVNHFKHYAKTEDIFKLPKVIRFLQEPRLEPGLLFHYCLSEKMDEQNIQVLIGGECHDQVYDKRLYYEMINQVLEPQKLQDYPMYGRLRLGEIDRIHTYKYFTDIETQWLLNEDIDYSELKVRLEIYSDVFVNYFMTKRLFCRKNNINIRLPYINHNYVNFIEANFGEEDLPFKTYHKKLCERFIDPKVRKELDKPTESSSPYSYLFLNDDEIREKLFGLILANNFCSTYLNKASVEKLFNAFEIALKQGRSNGDFYKASILSCRIFEILGLILWHAIFIQKRDSDEHLYTLLEN